MTDKKIAIVALCSIALAIGSLLEGCKPKDKEEEVGDTEEVVALRQAFDSLTNEYRLVERDRNRWRDSTTASKQRESNISKSAKLVYDKIENTTDTSEQLQQLYQLLAEVPKHPIERD